MATASVRGISTVFRQLKKRHAEHWHSTFARRATIGSLIAFLVSLDVQYYAIAYATSRASMSNTVTDIFLSNVPAVNLDGTYVYGLLIFIGFVILLLLLRPKQAPFVLYSFALFVVIRSFFNTLTHLAPYAMPYDPNFNATMQKLFFGSDMFFSGHTGAPFLMALMYWREKALRYLFIAWSVFFGITVLLGHLHYSIDVAAAFFITYTIRDIARWLFPRSLALFRKGEEAVI